jgi:hypothetical protein
MSIDERLRVGLRAQEDAPTDQASFLAGWADVEARVAAARTRDRARWAVGIAAAVVLLAAAAVSWWPRSDADVVRPIAPTPSPSATTPGPDPVETSWTTGPVSAQGIADQLGSAGLGEWSDAVLAGVPTEATLSYQLKLRNGRITLTRSVSGAAAEVQDSETYVVNGASLELTPDGSSCVAVLGWQVEGDQLRLRVVSDSCPDYQGTPDEAYMQALYGAFPFTHLGS